MATVFRSRVMPAHTIGLFTVAVLLGASGPLFAPDFSKQVYSLSGGKSISLFPLSKYDLVHDSELIILGKVLDQNSEVPTIRNIVQVDKVIKGNYEGKTIDVMTEGDLSGNIIVEGPAKFDKGENVILFLYREQVYSGEYTTMGMEQGKFQVGTNGLVEGKLMAGAGYDLVYSPLNATTIADFETDIKNIFTEPKPEQITEDVAPGDRDLTTEEVKVLERNTTGDFVVK